MRCAVVMLPGEDGDGERFAASLRKAVETSKGAFREIKALMAPAGSAQNSFAAASRRAASEGFDWLLVSTDAETVVPEIFAKVAPALRIHDAVWGGAGVIRDGNVVPLERITRLAAQDYSTFFHLALQWWIGPTHFVRPGVAVQAFTEGGNTETDYRLAVWKEHLPLKAAHALTLFHGALPRLPAVDREILLQRLDEEPVFSTVRQGGRTFRLPYTGRNPIIERDHTRGQFFEHQELAWLAEALPRGLRIVDAGANTGNHTVFFAGAMDAESVIPLEPDLRACAAIRTTVSVNELANVRLDLLGSAVGAQASRMRPVFSAGGGLGATRLVPDPEGIVPVHRLDDLPLGKVDLLKIDVEGMEMAVLAGADEIIRRDRPAIFIEVLDETIAEFLAWVDANGYSLERLFPDKTHSNYLVAPAGLRR